ncbi:MAG TPA: hypothetical protein VFN55_16545 [Solirubrobacteraceae bacterium]|nr:hypothetical protein [Solirubrobacteraceae bacterium]
MAVTPGPPAGLCDRCRHQQVVTTTRGSRFSLCRRSRDEPDRFPRYPRLPVLACPGFTARPRDPVDEGPGAGSA